MSGFVTVAKKDDLKPGEGKPLEVNGKTIALFNVNGEFYAIDNTCAHQGGPLGEGQLEDSTVTCPWHAWQYDVKTGRKVDNEQVKVDSYEVKVEGDEVRVKTE